METLKMISGLLLGFGVLIAMAWVFAKFWDWLNYSPEYKESPEEIEERERREWIMQYGTTGEKTLLQLQIQNELLVQQNEMTRRVGGAVAWGNYMDTIHELEGRD